MKVSKPRQTTVKKYTTYLKSFLIKCDKEGFSFDRIEFIKEAQITGNFFKYCEKLGYVRSEQMKGSNIKRWIPLISSNSVELYHGRRIAEMSLRYNIKHRPGDNEHQVIGGEKAAISKDDSKNDFKRRTPLYKYEDSELLEELKRRGYRGTLDKEVKTIKKVSI